MSHYANIFQMLMRLRQACDHPYLVLTRDRDTTVPDTFLGDVEQARWPPMDDALIWDVALFMGANSTAVCPRFARFAQLVAKFVGTPIGPNISYASQVVREIQERSGASSLDNNEPAAVAECPLCLGTFPWWSEDENEAGSG